MIISSRNSNYLQKKSKRWESGFGPKVAIDWLNPAEQINDFKTFDYPAKQRVPAIEQNSFRLLLQKDSLICDQACRSRWHKFEIFLEKQKFSRVHWSQKIFWVKSWADCSSHCCPRPAIRGSAPRLKQLSHIHKCPKVYNTRVMVYKCTVRSTIHGQTMPVSAPYTLLGPSSADFESLSLLRILNLRKTTRNGDTTWATCILRVAPRQIAPSHVGSPLRAIFRRFRST